MLSSGLVTVGLDANVNAGSKALFAGVAPVTKIYLR